MDRATMMKFAALIFVFFLCHASRGCVFDETTVQRMMDAVNTENIRENLRFLASQPHLAGTPRDDELVQYIKGLFEEAGLDTVETTPYEVMLSHPDFDKPNQVHLVDENGNLISNSSFKEHIYNETEDSANFVPAYHCFSPAGDITGDIVFANYGRQEDFDRLRDMDVEVNGKICIIKLGKIFRGSKVAAAAQNGAIGVLLYPDPADYAAEGTEEENVYPNKWWLPGSAMQRGSVYGSWGDPLTPGWPSIAGAIRLNESDVEHIPNIPAQPIGYDDAKRILELMGGEQVPHEWNGAVPGVEYRLGPGFIHPHNTTQVRLVVNNILKYNVTIENVIGMIKGAVEPDRYVIYGNHRDSWGFGAADAVSGTTGLLEAVRIFGDMKRQGCRPRRTIIFCSFGAEEVPLFGSTEWVEENLAQLDRRGVAMVNLDTCMGGPAFRPKVSPFLWTSFLEAMRQIQDGMDANRTLYEAWASTFPENQEPELELLKMMSDHVAFDSFVGIPSITFRYFPDDVLSGNYPAYHTGYDTIRYVEKFLDPEYQYMASCAKLSVVFLANLADSPLVPLDSRRAALKMRNTIQSMKTNGVEAELNKHDASIDSLGDTVDRFVTAAERWHENAAKLINSNNTLIVRMLSDQSMSVQKAFLLPEGLPGRPLARNAVFSMGQHDLYNSHAFPGIKDLLHGIDKLDPDKKILRENQLQKHISDLLVVVHRASLLLSLDHIPSDWFPPQDE